MTITVISVRYRGLLYAMSDESVVFFSPMDRERLDSFLGAQTKCIVRKTFKVQRNNYYIYITRVRAFSYHILYVVYK
jgi:hypothetical protein